mmetsp:Transcript_35052/g.58954  ORF Transcript_35052/g.58954 Transcript_35052/m.58954 type:complete len:255 (-) Transcript_35052:12901-13665(-)
MPHAVVEHKVGMDGVRVLRRAREVRPETAERRPRELKPGGGEQRRAVRNRAVALHPYHDGEISHVQVEARPGRHRDVVVHTVQHQGVAAATVERRVRRCWLHQRNLDQGLRAERGALSVADRESEEVAFSAEAITVGVNKQRQVVVALRGHEHNDGARLLVDVHEFELEAVHADLAHHSHGGGHAVLSHVQRSERGERGDKELDLVARVTVHCAQRHRHQRVRGHLHLVHGVALWGVVVGVHLDQTGGVARNNR